MSKDKLYLNLKVVPTKFKALELIWFRSEEPPPIKYLFAQEAVFTKGKRIKGYVIKSGGHTDHKSIPDEVILNWLKDGKIEVVDEQEG